MYVESFQLCSFLANDELYKLSFNYVPKTNFVLKSNGHENVLMKKGLLEEMDKDQSVELSVFYLLVRMTNV